VRRRTGSLLAYIAYLNALTRAALAATVADLFGDVLAHPYCDSLFFFIAFTDTTWACGRAGPGQPQCLLLGSVSATCCWPCSSRQAGVPCNRSALV